jgi:hypothetical protein
MFDWLLHELSKVQKFVDEIIADRKLHPICNICGHGKDRHAFDVYPMHNKDKPCELSCIECFDQVTEQLKKNHPDKMENRE